jgi:predicted RNA-binding Zn-ribbon protein involved in translation (DUF1610 family)
MRPQNVAAHCPKCGQPALRRSHSHYRFEKIRKKYSAKRPFRCHQCRWRGWIDETQLRYPVIMESLEAWDQIGDDSDIPNIDLESEVQNAPLSKPTTHEDKEEFLNWRRRQPPETSSEAEPSPPAERIVPTSKEEMIPLAPDTQNSSGNIQQISYVSRNHHQGTRHTSLACPGCGETSLHRSRVQSIKEAFRRRFTKKRPYRCHKCGWRGWLHQNFL